jgi:hypothetical protein
MSRNEEHLPEDLRDIAERLTEARATFTPLELDDLHGRLRRRTERRRGTPGRRRFATRFRMNSVAGLVAAGLMLTSGAGAVIAATSFGGDDHGRSGDNFGKNFGDTYGGTSFNHGRDGSFCQYHGPIVHHYFVHTRHGLVEVIVTVFCGHVHYHIEFIPDRGFRSRGDRDGQFDYRFDGQGPTYWSQGSSCDGNAPDGTTEISVGVDGSNYNLPTS